LDCIICRESKNELFSNSSYFNIPVYKCTKCGILITGKSEYEIKEKASKLYGDNYWNDEFKIIDSYALTDANSSSRKRDLISQYAYIKQYLENKKSFFEIGTGYGVALHWFLEKGFEVSGLEPNPKCVELINKKFGQHTVICDYAENLIVDKKFDIIWMNDVIEHLVRPDIVLRKCYNMLNNDGILFIETGNCDNPKILNSSIYENPDICHFTKKSLSELAKSCGFNIERADYFRPAKKSEGFLNLVSRQCHFLKYPYYPRIQTKAEEGFRIRMILRK